VEVDRLRTALLTNKALHRPKNFREKPMKNYNSNNSKGGEGKSKESTSDIVRFLMNNSERMTLPVDSEDDPSASLNLLRAPRSTWRRASLNLFAGRSARELALEQEANANIGIAKVLETLNKQHDIRWDKVCCSFFVDFSLAASAPQGVLVATTMVVLYRFNLFALLELDDNDVSRFLAKVEQGYLSNPYHNAAHAADVTARLGTILHTSGIARRMLSTGDMGAVKLLAVILAAAIHDYEHPGHTNQYAVVMGLKQAKIYNDKNVYENWSVYRALAHMDMPSFPFYAFPFRHELRTSIIKFVLATDMSSHFDQVGNAKNTLLGLIKKPDKGIEFFELKPKQQDAILQLALKVADIGHTATPMGQHIRWVQRLQDEFFAQGDMERANAITISPLMDRTKSGPCKGCNQVGFFEVIVIPLYKLWMVMFPTCKPLLHQVSKNLEFWKQHPGDPPALLDLPLSRPSSSTSLASMETLIATFRSSTATQQNEVAQFRPSFDTYHSYSSAADYVGTATTATAPPPQFLHSQRPLPRHSLDTNSPPQFVHSERPQPFGLETVLSRSGEDP